MWLCRIGSLTRDAMLLVEWEGVNVVDDNESRIGSLTRMMTMKVELVA